MRDSTNRPATAIFAAVLICGIQTICASGLSAWTAAGQNPRKEAALTPVERSRIRQAIAAVGLILVRSDGDLPGEEPRPRGSGVVVRADGVVATNYHVIAESRTNRLYADIFFELAAEGARTPSQQGRYRLRPIVVNKEQDLALLRALPEGPAKSGARDLFPAVELGDSRAVELLDDLTIIGFPEKGGVTVTISRGVVEGKDVLKNWIKTDARVIHGNSGGAAVSRDGKLIGIPTKVVADSQPIDKNGDGFPDDYRVYGAVGFLRPAYLITEMLNQARSPERGLAAAPAAPQTVKPAAAFNVRGIVRSAGTQKPVAGALVGLSSTGAAAITAASLLTWGGTNADGRFVLNNPVPAGRYSVRAKAIGFEPYAGEVEVGENAINIVIELRAAKEQK